MRGENEGEPWSKSDGFSAGTPILTFLPGLSGDELAGEEDIDASLASDSPTIIFNAETGELVPHFAEIDVRAETVAQRSLVMRPVVRLQDGVRYIVAARNLSNEDGNLIEPSAVFAALRDGTSSEEESVEERRALYEDIFEKLGDASWSRDDIQIAWDFTTASDQNNTQWLLHMRDEALQIVEDDGGIEYRIVSVDPNYQTDNIAFRIEGEYRVPLYTNQPETGALLNFGDDGMPEVNTETPWAWVPFLLLIPNSASTPITGGVKRAPDSRMTSPRSTSSPAWRRWSPGRAARSTSIWSPSNRQYSTMTTPPVLRGMPEPVNTLIAVPGFRPGRRELPAGISSMSFRRDGLSSVAVVTSSMRTAIPSIADWS